MKDTSFMYKVAILLALGAGFISVTQTQQLRNQLREEREYLAQHENQSTVLQKESFHRSFENGYKKCLVDLYYENPKYLLTKDPKTNLLVVWKKDTVEKEAKTSKEAKE